MSLEGLTDENVEIFKSKLIEKVLNLLPAILKEITPAIIELTSNILQSHVKETKSSQKIDSFSTESVDREVKSFKNRHQKFFDKKLQEREHFYYKDARCVHQLDLYNDCAQAEPLYIPRKFRRDNFHVKSDAELTVLSKMEIQRFQSECELLCIRRDEYTKKLFDIDQDIEKFITNCKPSSEAHISSNKRPKLGQRLPQLTFAEVFVI